MDIEFCPSPTAAETKALASLPTLAPLKNDRVYEVLGEILSFCRQPDVQGFLFTEDQIQVPHFLKPSVLDGAFSGSVLETRVEPGKISDKTVTDHCVGSFALYPAFASRDISFGFAANNIVYSPLNEWEAERGFSFNSELRYVRDNKRNILMSVADAEEAGIIQFQYTRQLSTTCHFRTCACFDRKVFKSVTVNDNYCANDLIVAMLQMHTGFDYRSCPLCMAPHGECPCELPMFYPRHPFDREMVLRNIQMHLGSFQGSANVVYLKDGNFVQSASVGVRMTLQGKFDRHLLERLRNWVLRRHIGIENPRHSHISRNEHPSDAQVSRFSVQDAKVEQGTEDILSSLGINTTPVLGNAENAGDSTYLSEILDLRSETQELSDANSGWSSTVLLMKSLMDGSERQSPAAVQEDKPERCKRRSSQSSQNIEQRVTEQVGFDALQKMKEERRKEQNRQSARKSNQKKKAFNDTLKQSLREAHQHAAFLRQRELSLRKENLELRKRLENQ